MRIQHPTFSSTFKVQSPIPQAPRFNMPGDAGLIYKLLNPSSAHLPYENEGRMGSGLDLQHFSSGSTTSECEVQTAFSVASPAKMFCSGSNLTGVVRVHVVVVNASALGSVQLQARNSSGSGTVTIKANSDLVGRRTG